MAKKAKKRRGGKPLPDLLRRHRALIATQARFGGKTFELGKADCVQLVRAHLVKMGHRGLPRPPSYSSPGGVEKALKALGADDLEQLFDRLLTRIPPAAMLPGDVGLIPGDPDAPAWRSGAVVISVGRKFLGWHPDHPMLAVLEPAEANPFIAAWRA